MRAQLPGRRRRRAPRGLLKPQHRMVLGLVSMSAAALMLSTMFQKDDGRGAAVPPEASTRASERTLIPLPTQRVSATEEASRERLGAAVEAVGPGVVACVDSFADGLRPWEGAATRIEVQLDARGIARADVLDLPGLPAPFLGCLGATLGTTDWPSGGADILLVRIPLTIPERARVVELAPAPSGD